MNLTDNLPSNGAVLIGTISEATNLPCYLECNSDIREEYFFRVLFADTSNQSTMQAKTPIFTSEVVTASNSRAPSWDDSQFRFEMLMPAGQPFVMHGEIWVVIYMARPTGGNDFIGQHCFDMLEISRSGDVDFLKSGVEARVIQGSFELVGRNGQCISGFPEIALKLELGWLVSESDDCDKISIVPSIRPKSAIGSKAPTKFTSLPKPTNNYSNIPPATAPLRKIASAGGKKKREDQMRIERENKRLQGVIKAHKGKASSGVISTGVAYGEPAAIAPPLSMPKDRAPISGNGSDNLQELVDMLASLKKDARGLEDENARLKGQLTRLKLMSSRYESATERATKKTGEGIRHNESKVSACVPASRPTGGAVNISSTRPSTAGSLAESKTSANNVRPGQNKPSSSSLNNEAKSTAIAAQRGISGSVAASKIDEDDKDYQDEFEEDEEEGVGDDKENDRDEADKAPDTNGDINNEEVELELDNMNDKEMTAAAHSAASMFDIDESLVTDLEFIDILAEHNCLQSMRVSLVKRLQIAKSMLDSSQQGKVQLKIRKDQALRQVLGTHTSTSSSNTPAKLSMSVTPEERIAHATTRLSQERLGLARSGEIVNEELHLSETQDTIAELSKIQDYLTNVKQGLVRDVENMRYERDICQARLQDLSESNQVYALRDSIAHMRPFLGKLKQELIFAPYQEQYATTELKLLHGKLRMKELESTK